MKKQYHTHTMDYYLAFKKKETLQYATTWMNSEDFMPSEINQSQKDKYYMTSLTHGI